MEEFLSDATWNWNAAAATNYGGLGLNTVDAADNQFELELAELLEDYENLTREPPKMDEGESIPFQDDSQDDAVSSVTTECISDHLGDISTAAVTPEPVLDPKLVKISDLASLVEELSEELEILLFYHRKCYIKNLSNSNYLRQTPTVPVGQVVTNLKRKFKTPYIVTRTENGALAVPSSDCGQKQFPFYHERTREWKPCDLDKLELCVINSFYHRQLFFIDARFQQMLFKMGFTFRDLSQIHNGKREMDDELWSVLRIHRIKEDKKIEKYQYILHKYRRIELELIEALVSEHQKKQKQPIVPLVIGRPPMAILIDLKDIIAWRQHEAERLYLTRLVHEGAVDVMNVDWLMVEKDVFFLTGRTESAEELKKMYRFCRSSEFNNDSMSATELDNLKKVFKFQERYTGIDWTNIATLLGTRRSPIRLFQTYKNFISPTETNTFLQNYDDKLSAFLHIKKFVGHIPRIVYRLQQKFGAVDYANFGHTWQEVNPRFAIGNFFVAEDAALLLVMELHKEGLSAGKNFSILQHRLPWRHCNIWRKRASTLFWNFDKWTFEEDQLLLYAVRKYGMEWNGLSKLFPNRAKHSVIVRCRHLNKKLVSGLTLSQYHSLYFRRNGKSNVFLLTKIAALFRRVIREQTSNNGGSGQEEVPDISGNIDYDENSDEELGTALSSIKTGLGPIRIDSYSDPMILENGTNGSPSKSKLVLCKSKLELDCGIQNLEFLQDVLYTESEPPSRQLLLLQNVCDWKTPTQKNVLHYLTTFDKSIVQAALNRLESYIGSQNRGQNFSNSLNVKSSKFVLTCDRRKFFPHDPVSVASALHLRRVELKPITTQLWKNLNEFEKTVCQAVRAYYSGWRTKKGSLRPSIPTAVALSFLPSIRNIILNPREIASDSTPIIQSDSQPPPLAIKQEPYAYEDIFPSTMISGNSEADTSMECGREISNNHDIKPVVEVVPNTFTMSEARNSLCRTVWNNSNSIKSKRRSKASQRSALNHAAARARWEKQAAKEKKMLEAESVAESGNNVRHKMPKQPRWYDGVLNKFGVDYAGGFEHLLYVGDEDSVLWKDADGVTGGPVVLTVLHDHAYAKDYAPSVKRVVDDIRSTFSKLYGEENGDSAKENENSQPDSGST